ncbi:MAG: hypothetical protein J6V11_04895 [Alphaproteobacteria bacterium]|nr:hypothetical protein [Alphaproteobacteria bacterium]
MIRVSASYIVLTALLCALPMTIYAQSNVSKTTTAEVKPAPKRLLSLDLLTLKATEAHALLNQLRSLRAEGNKLVKREKEYAEAQERFKELNDCNVKRLADQFKNPKEVWQKITDTYDAKEKELAIYINSAEPSTDSGVLKEDGLTSYTDQEIAELLAYWSLGNEILTDVYANQDSWGERKSPRAPSFPLWKDQKYFFDKDWNDYYTKLNVFFGVPPQGRPKIDDRKYDYKRADETRAAHQAYMKVLTAKNPKQALLLPDELKAGPAVAPRPLPPAEESTMYIGDIEKTHQIFPAWPEPWRKQIENNFANYNTKGELAKDFVVRTFRLKNEVGGVDGTERNNRLNIYQAEKKSVDGAKKMVEASKAIVKAKQQTLQGALEQAGINISVDVDITNPKEYAKLEQAINARKNEYIKQVEERLDSDPWNDSIKYEIEALKKDKTGKVSVSKYTAIGIDQALLEADSIEALQQKQEKFADEQMKKAQKPINKKCLLGND